MLLNTTAKRDEIRRQKNKPFYVKNPWLEKELLQTLDEIDRLREKIVEVSDVGYQKIRAIHEKGIEQRTKEACIKRIKQEKWLGKWDVETLEQAIDSAKIK